MEANLSIGKSLAEALRTVKAEITRLQSIEYNLNNLLKGDVIQDPEPTHIPEIPPLTLTIPMRKKRNIVKRGGNDVVWPAIVEALKTYGEPLTAKGVAVLLGMPPSTVAHYMRRNRRKLTHVGHTKGYVLTK